MTDQHDDTDPVELHPLTPREITAVVDMAVVVQANLVQLHVAQSKRIGDGGRPERGIRTPAPGAVTRFREVLLAARQIAGYDELVLALRLREVWGQHCLMCWFFGVADPQEPPAFRDLLPDPPLRCPMALAVKTLEIEKCLWRLRFELRLREDPTFRRDPTFQEKHEAAQEIPVMVMGQNIRVSSPENILLTSCEFAGMLAAARWIADERLGWADPGIMELPPDGQIPC